MSVFQGAARIANPSVNYDKMTRAQLLELAESLGICLPKRATKTEIIAAVRAATN